MVNVISVSVNLCKGCHVIWDQPLLVEIANHNPPDCGIHPRLLGSIVVSLNKLSRRPPVSETAGLLGGANEDGLPEVITRCIPEEATVILSLAFLAPFLSFARPKMLPLLAIIR